MDEKKKIVRPESPAAGWWETGPANVVVWLLSPVLLVLTAIVLAVGFFGIAITSLCDTLRGGMGDGDE